VTGNELVLLLGDRRRWYWTWPGAAAAGWLALHGWVCCPARAERWGSSSAHRHWPGPGAWLPNWWRA